VRRLIFVLIFIVMINSAAALTYKDNFEFMIYGDDEECSPKSFMLGDQLFKAGPFEYLCSGDGDWEYATKQPGCWKTDATLGSSRFALIPGEPYQLNDYITVEVESKGRLCCNWMNTFYFQFQRDFIELQIDQKPSLWLGQDNHLTLSITNNLFSSSGGFYIRYNNKEYELQDYFKYGDSELTLNIHPEKIGNLELEIIPFILINTRSEELAVASENKIKQTYNVIPYVEGRDTSIKCSSNSDCPGGNICKSLEDTDGKEYNLCVKHESLWNRIKDFFRRLFT